MTIKVNVNGVTRDAADATIPALDHGFLFGDSVYETLRCYDGHLFRSADHMRRQARLRAGWLM